MKCNKCGFNNQDGQSYCGNCGSPLNNFNNSPPPPNQRIDNQERSNQNVDNSVNNIQHNNKPINKDTSQYSPISQNNKNYNNVKELKKKNKNKNLIIVGGLCLFLIIILFLSALLSSEDETNYLVIEEPKISADNYTDMRVFTIYGNMSSAVNYPSGLRVSMVLYDNEGKQVQCFNAYGVHDIPEGYGYVPGTIDSWNYSDPFDFQANTNYMYLFHVYCSEVPSYGYVIVTDIEENNIIHKEYVNMTGLDYYQWNKTLEGN